jgi:site-specific recombinase XerD
MVRVTVYRRHSGDCTKKDSKDQKRSCECKVWLGWSKDGKQYQVSAKTRDWVEGEARAREIESRFKDAAEGRESPSAAKSVTDAIAAFIQKKKNGGHVEDTIYRHEHIMGDLQTYCNQNGILFVKDLTLDHLNKWQTGWTVKAPQAVRSQQEKVRNFFKYALANNWISMNPAIPDKWESPKINRREREKNIRAFTPEEYERILSSIDKTTMTPVNKARVHALMQLQRWSGLSLVDAVMLAQDELRLESGRGKIGEFRVVTDRQKTGGLINNPIPYAVGEELLKVKNGNPKYFFWSGVTTAEDAPSYFHKLYRKVFKAAGIDGSSHDLRHTYAIGLLLAGTDIRTVSKALGHSSVTITEGYYARWCVNQQNQFDDTLRAALEG